MYVCIYIYIYIVNKETIYIYIYNSSPARKLGQNTHPQPQNTHRQIEFTPSPNASSGFGAGLNACVPFSAEVRVKLSSKRPPGITEFSPGNSPATSCCRGCCCDCGEVYAESCWLIVSVLSVSKGSV